MSIEDKMKLVTKNAEEVILKEEIQKILTEKEKPRAYVGFELSGLLHLGTGLVIGNKLQDLAKAGFETVVFLADWHSWINNKLGADMDKIKIAGEYFQKAFESVGVKGPNIKYIWASELVERSDYWAKVVRVAKANSLARIMRTMPIMGRKTEGEIQMSEVALTIKAYDKASMVLGQVGGKLGIMNKQGLAMGVAFAGINMAVGAAMNALQGIQKWIGESIRAFRDFEMSIAEVSTMLGDMEKEHLPAHLTD